MLDIYQSIVGVWDIAANKRSSDPPPSHDAYIAEDQIINKFSLLRTSPLKRRGNDRV